MKFILFVEGETEDIALREFLERWLNSKLAMRVGIKTVRSEGWPQLVRDAPKKAQLYLNGPGGNDIIAVISLLDLYGPTFYPNDIDTPSERYGWAKAYLEQQVNHPRFYQHFAVHEIEAWLFSEPSIFPNDITKAIENKYPTPETINNREPPAKLLDNIYTSRLKRGYRKKVDGKALFAKLNTDIAYQKCPSLKALLDEMLRLAQEAGL